MLAFSVIQKTTDTNGIPANIPMESVFCKHTITVSNRSN